MRKTERRRYRRFAIVMLITVLVPMGFLACLSVLAQSREAELLLSEMHENHRLLAQAAVNRFESELLQREKRVQHAADLLAPDEVDDESARAFVADLEERVDLMEATVLMSESGDIPYPASPFGRHREESVSPEPFVGNWPKEQVERHRRIAAANSTLKTIEAALRKAEMTTEEATEAIRKCRGIIKEVDDEATLARASLTLALLLAGVDEKGEALEVVRRAFDGPPALSTHGVPICVEARTVALEMAGGADRAGAREAYAAALKWAEYFASAAEFRSVWRRIATATNRRFADLEKRRATLEELDERRTRARVDFLPALQSYLQRPFSFPDRRRHIRRGVAPRMETYAYFALDRRLLHGHRRVRFLLVYRLSRKGLLDIAKRVLEGFHAGKEITITLRVGDKTLGKEEGETREFSALAYSQPPAPPVTAEVLSPHIGPLRSWLTGRAVTNFLLVSILVLAAGMGVLFVLRGLRREMDLVQLRSEFVSSVSHELKTPLTSIRMFAEMLLAGRVRGEDKRREYVEIIASESQRLTRLITNVLDFARVDEGRKRFHMKRTDLREAVRRALAVLSYHIRTQGFTVERSLPEEPVWIRGDAEAMEQVAVNLISNAIKFSGEEKWAKVSVRRDGDGAVLEVVDRGIGIPTEEIPRVFERFFRSSVTSASQRPGTGIGLTLVNSIVEAHNGRMEVRSRVGEGSAFRVLLPAYEEAGDGQSAGGGGRVAHTDGNKR